LPKLKNISGQECIKILCNSFGFTNIRQKGSHVVLKKEVGNTVHCVVVPLHSELKMETLSGILDLAKVYAPDFAKYLTE
jgi:predicted RNA binding protein YcfA (HicA-like mRNA interferase family)